MISSMKKIIVGGSFLSLFSVASVFAKEAESAGPATFAGSYTLWIAIIIGFIASILTFYYSSQMSGSTVGGILKLFGFGMLVVVLGFLSVVVAWAEPSVQKIVHDLLFILGYILMLVGVSRMRKLSL